MRRYIYFTIQKLMGFNPNSQLNVRVSYSHLRVTYTLLPGNLMEYIYNIFTKQSNYKIKGNR